MPDFARFRFPDRETFFPPQKSAHRAKTRRPAAGAMAVALITIGIGVTMMSGIFAGAAAQLVAQESTMADGADEPEAAAAAADGAVIEGPVFLSSAWLRIKPPPGWRRVPVEAPYELGFERVGTLVKWRTQPLPGADAQAAAQLAADPALREWRSSSSGGDAPWQLEAPRTAPLGTVAFEVIGTQIGVGPRKVVAVAIHAGMAAILVAEGGAIADWYRPDLYDWFAPVPGCNGILGLFGDGGAVPLPLGFTPKLSDLRVAGASTADPADPMHLFAAVLPSPQAFDLDSAFGALERALELAHGWSRSSGRAFNVAESDGFLFAAQLRPIPSAPERQRVAVGWFGFRAATSRLLAIWFECSPARTAEMDALLRTTILPHLVAPLSPSSSAAAQAASGAPSGLASVAICPVGRISAEKPARWAVVFLDTADAPIAFADVPFTLSWQIVAGDGTVLARSAAPMVAKASAALLPGADLAATLTVPPAIVAAAGATLSIRVEFSDRTFTATAPLKPLFAGH